MATEIERLAVLIEANTASYTKAMEKLSRDTQRAINTSTKSLNGLNSTFGKLGTTVGGFAKGFAGAFSVAAFGRFITGSIKAGEEIGDLSQKLGITAEQFQELSFVADQAGASQETLVTGFRAMTKVLGEAQRGSKGALDEFKALGVSFEELQKMDPADAFVKLATTIGKIQNPLTRNAELMKFFGKSGTDLAQIAGLTADQIANLREEIRKSGGVASNEDIAKTQGMADALDKFNRVIKATGITVAAYLAPAISKIADYIASDDFKAGIKGIADYITTTLKEINAILSATQALWQQVKAGPAAVGTSAGLSGMSSAFDLLFPGSAASATKPYGGHGPGRSPTGPAPLAATAGSGGLELAFPDAEAEKANADKLARLHRQVTDAIEADNQRIVDQMNDIRDATREALGTFVHDMLEGKKATEALSDVLTQLADRLLNSGLDALLSGFLGPQGGRSTGILGSLFAGARAGGGGVSTGRSYLVGERGPEMFIPHTPGTIAPGAGGALNFAPQINMDLRGADRSLVDRMPAILAQNNRYLLSEVQKMRNDPRYRPVQ